MKINELIGELKIAISNEEDALLEKITSIHNMHSFTEREQFVLNSLIRKSLVSKVNHKGLTFVKKNT